VWPCLVVGVGIGHVEKNAPSNLGMPNPRVYETLQNRDLQQYWRYCVCAQHWEGGVPDAPS